MERQRIFQRLKQPCIELLQATATFTQRPNGKRDLVHALSSLLTALNTTTSAPGALDTKLVEYAFVPVSQVLRLSQLVPVRALELCLECVSVLLRAGWGGGLEPALSGQLLILFTFLAKPSSAENGIAATSEELQALAFKCIAELLAQTSRSKSSRDALTATNNIPALGEAVLVTLDSLAESKSNAVKLAAVTVVRTLDAAIADDDALASFFPKIVSSLTKILTPGSTNKAGFRVIEQSLEAMRLLFLRLLSDRNTNNLPKEPSSSKKGSDGVLRSASWLQATASQIKIALANIYKMRDHDKPEVRRALLRLCLCVIQDCRTSLSDCTTMSIETVISLAGEDGHDTVEGELRMILSTDEKLSDLLRESLHNWVVSFPRIMQSKDDTKRRLIIHQISVTLRLLAQDPTTIDERLADGLRDGISAVLADSKGLEELGSATSVETDLMLAASKKTAFQPLQLRLKGQQDLMGEFRLLLSQLAMSDSALTVVQNLVRTVDTGTQEMRLASYWTSVNLLRDLTVSNPSLDDFIDFGSNPREELLEDLYLHSVTLLTDRDPNTTLPWHFYALALETVALQAIRYRTEFRAELGEVLYPILHQLGSSNPALREHAITCLDIVSDASGYLNARELVVDNVDYIVNAVGLKLAVGDVSMQAPQVLLMMMRLCGPSLLPYLDDLVGSIFEALERYHGYPALVELLFSVLKGMTEEGVKAPQLAIEATPSSTAVGYQDIPMTDVVSTLVQMNSDRVKREQEAAAEVPVPFPQEPWKDSDASAPSDSQPPEPPEPPPPAARTYQILLTISTLTQHYLTSTSPSLRTSLLSLLQTTIPALAKHENSFLPLINTLWPVLLPRLQDPEAYIVANTLSVVALMCTHAGSFMRSRIEPLFPTLKTLHRRTQQPRTRTTTKQPTSHSTLLEPMQTRFADLTLSSTNTPDAQPTLYASTPARMLWDALVHCLCQIAAHVALRDEQFEAVLDILDPVLAQPHIKATLDAANADAVWLRLYRREVDKGGRGVDIPVHSGWAFVAV